MFRHLRPCPTHQNQYNKLNKNKKKTASPPWCFRVFSEAQYDAPCEDRGCGTLRLERFLNGGARLPEIIGISFLRWHMLQCILRPVDCSSGCTFMASSFYLFTYYCINISIALLRGEASEKIWCTSTGASKRQIAFFRSPVLTKKSMAQNKLFH